MTRPFDCSQARQIALRYLDTVDLMSLGAGGGFSGAEIWRVESPRGTWRLKAWPANALSADRLARIHHWICAARNAGSHVVPEIARDRNGNFGQFEFNRFWDLAQWMPGEANFKNDPTPGKIAAAALELAKLHRTWSHGERNHAAAPAVVRRYAAWNEWNDFANSGWKPNRTHHDLLVPILFRAWDVCRPSLAEVPALLEPFRDQAFDLHPCLADIWHDHVLFTGDRVTGLIDYGSMRIDTPATDLARMLGSMAGDDVDLRRAALAAYRTIQPLSPLEQRLMEVLDATGAQLAVAHWLIKLDRVGPSDLDVRRVGDHLRTLVERLERSTRSIIS